MQRRSSMRILLITLWMAGFLGLLPAAAAPPQLRYVVVIIRHGVRSPTWDSERLNQYSAGSWPEFGVANGYLTPHGRVLIKRMGAFFGDWLSAEGLLKQSGCRDAGRVHIWADKEQRTLETGYALAEAMLAGCAISVHSQQGNGSDPLFDPISAGLAKPDLQVAAEAVRDRMGREPQQLLEVHRSAFDTLQYVLTGGKSAPKNFYDSSVEVGVSDSGQFFVETQYMAQTLDQMRSAVPLTISSPPATQDVLVPGCQSADQNRRCSWQS